MADGSESNDARGGGVFKLKSVFSGCHNDLY